MEEPYSVIISLEHRVPLDDEDPYDDVVQHYESRIVRGFDEEEAQTIAGTLDFYVVNVGLAMNRGLDIVDVADSIDQDLYEYCETLFEPGTSSELREEILEQFEYPFGKRLLILHLAKVFPEYRGKRLGLVAARRIIEQFGDGLVIARPQPLQHHDEYSTEEEMRYETFEPAHAAALKRLTRHWQRLGFEPIGDTGFLGLSTAIHLPEPKLVDAKTPPRKPNPKQKRSGVATGKSAVSSSVPRKPSPTKKRSGKRASSR